MRHSSQEPIFGTYLNHQPMAAVFTVVIAALTESEFTFESHLNQTTTDHCCTRWHLSSQYVFVESFPGRVKLNFVSHATPPSFKPN
jgi:hypothetical protein